MKENRCKVLWLDDYFDSKSSNDDMEESIKGFLDDVNRAFKFGIEVKGVSNYKEFLKCLEEKEKYQAVILDIRGLDPDDVLNDTTFREVYYKSRDKHMLIYVYSANITEPKFEFIIEDKERCFSKGRSVTDFYQKIRDDFENNLNYYSGHEYCLRLFQEGFLTNDENKKNMDTILKNDKELSDLDIYNMMRKIIENMFDKLKESDAIKLTSEKSKDILNYIVRDCQSNGKRGYDRNKPLFPDEWCSAKIKNTISFLWEIINDKSHNANNNGCFWDVGESIEDYNVMIKELAYKSFYVVMKWYYGFMNWFVSDNKAKEINSSLSSRLRMA